MGWTDERVELTKTLWADGQSASQIAKQLGGVSRNGVIGKLHRMGLSGRHQASKPVRLPRPEQRMKPRPVAPAFAPSSPVGGKPARAQPPAYAEDKGGLAPLPEAERCAHFCRWPIGDPLTPEFSYCGREQGFLASGRHDPYCPQHRDAERARAGKPRSDPAKLAGWIDKQDGRQRIAMSGGVRNFR